MKRRSLLAFFAALYLAVCACVFTAPAHGATPLVPRAGFVTPVSAATPPTAFAANTFSTAADVTRYAVVTAAGTTSPITRLRFRVSTIVSPPQFRWEIRSVDGTTGLPSATVRAATAAFTPGANGTVQTVTFPTPYSPSTVDENIAFVLMYDNGTFDASHTFALSGSVTGMNARAFPFFATSVNSESTWTTNTGQPMFQWGDAGSWYGTLLSNVASSSVTGGASSHEYGLGFNLPAELYATYQVKAVRIGGGNAGLTGKNLTVNLYDSDGTSVLQTVTHDLDNSLGGVNGYRELRFSASSLSNLVGGTNYRIGIAPSDATAFVLYNVSVSTAADWDTFAMGGQQFWLTDRTLSSGTWGAWTDTLTTRPWMEVILGTVTYPTTGTASKKVHQ